jgi:hypothetical protein
MIGMKNRKKNQCFGRLEKIEPLDFFNNYNVTIIKLVPYSCCRIYQITSIFNENVLSTC